jgi:putative NADH-flavin reductase
MRLLVLGASGKTGRHLIDQGLARGHRITALVRPTAKVIAAKGDALEVRVGSALNADELAAVMAGHDATLSALGSGIARTSVRAEGARSTLEAMRRTSVRRLIVISASLLDPNLGFLERLLRATLLRHLVADLRAMEAVVEATDFDWTILRPPQLVQDSLTRRYRLSAEGPLEGGSRMTFADIANCMLDVLENQSHRRKVVCVRG